MFKQRAVLLLLLLVGIVVWWKIEHQEKDSSLHRDERKTESAQKKPEKTEKTSEIEIHSKQVKPEKSLVQPQEPVISTPLMDPLLDQLADTNQSNSIQKKSIQTAKKQNKTTKNTSESQQPSQAEQHGVIATPGIDEEATNEPTSEATKDALEQETSSLATSSSASQPLFVIASEAVSVNSVVWQVEVDGLDEKIGDVVEVRLEQGHAWISQADWSLLRLDHLLPPENLADPNQRIDMMSYGAVRADEPNGRLFFSLFAPYRKTTILDFNNKAQKSAKPTEILQSSFLNYAFNYRYLTSNQNTDDIRAYSTFLDFNHNVGAFRFSHQAVRTASTQQDVKWDRLSTRFVYDDLSRVVSYVVGDAYSNAGQNSNPVRFGGIQVAKDFSLQPGFLTQPKTDIDGLAASPSTLDIFVDNIKVRSSAIDAGPFSIQNLSGFSGSLARILIKDELGNEKLIVAPLFGGANVLKKGLSNFAFQLGKQRPDYQHYEGNIASGFYRYGLTDWLTAELNAEYAGATDTDNRIDHKGANFALSTPIGNWSVSRRVGSGQQNRVGYDKVWRLSNISAVSFNINRLAYSDDYRIIGGGVITNKESRNFQLDFSYKRWNVSWFNSYLSNNKVNSVSLNHSLWGDNQGNFGLSLNKNVDRSTGKSDQSVSVYISVPLGANRKTNRTKSVSVSVNRTQEKEWTQNLSYQDSTTQTLGYSYQINQKLSSDIQKSLSANLNYRSTFAEMGLGSGVSLLRSDQNNLTRSTELQGFFKGAFVFTQNQFFLSQPIDNAFVLVDAGAANVGIQVNGKNSGNSSKQGKAVIAYSIFPLIDNRISLDAQTAPDRYNGNVLHAVPIRQSGTAVTFLYPSVVNLKIANQTQGVLKVGDKYFPITDQGCFVELVPNTYQGELDDGRLVHFVVPKIDLDSDIPIVEVDVDQPATTK